MLFLRFVFFLAVSLVLLGPIAMSYANTPPVPGPRTISAPKMPQMIPLPPSESNQLDPAPTAILPGSPLPPDETKGSRIEFDKPPAQ